MSSLFLGVKYRCFCGIPSWETWDSAKLHTAIKGLRGKMGVGAATQNLCNFVTRSLMNSCIKKIISIYWEHLRGGPGRQVWVVECCCWRYSTDVQKHYSLWSSFHIQQELCEGSWSCFRFQFCHSRPTWMLHSVLGFLFPNSGPLHETRLDYWSFFFWSWFVHNSQKMETP